jgi:hypothetical protein
MPKQDSKPRRGNRQPDLATELEKDRRAPAKDLAASVDEKAKSGDADARAVARAVRDLDGDGD